LYISRYSGAGTPTNETTTNSGAHTHSVSGTAAAQTWSGTVTMGAGDAETRPVNLTVNTFIKIN
jgi:hypothetical protein